MQTVQLIFPKSYRLLRRYDFTRLSSNANVVSRSGFLIVWKNFGYDKPRIGITASRKVGGAVVRNMIKRQVREFFRHNVHTIPPVDLNVIIRRRASEMDFSELYHELALAFSRIRMQ